MRDSAPSLSRETEKGQLSRANWRRVVASGALWTLVYNLVWGMAWFAFMRQEWEGAVAALGRPLPWTAEVWFLWVVMTVPIGIAIMLHTASRTRSAYRVAVSAASVVWLLLTLPMAAYSLSQSLSIRVIALDSSVNLVGLIAASFAGTWSHGRNAHE